MKVKELIAILNNIENKDREIQILIGDEDNDSLGCETIELLHTDDVEQCVELFCHIEDCYTDEVFPQSKIKIVNNNQ
jgi:hypothetical protein